MKQGVRHAHHVANKLAYTNSILHQKVLTNGHHKPFSNKAAANSQISKTDRKIIVLAPVAPITSSKKQPTMVPSHASEYAGKTGIFSSIRSRFGAYVAAFVMAITPIFATLGQEKGKQQNERIENGVKIVGEKYFDVGRHENYLYLYKLKINGELKDVRIDMSKDSTESFIWNGSPIRQLIYTKLDGLESVYLVFEKGIICVSFDKDRMVPRSGALRSSDGSKLFLHDGAVFVAADGSILATSPTTLLVNTSNGTINSTYREMFGDVPPLKKPIFSRGKNDDYVDLRDAAIMDGNRKLKIQIDLTKLEVAVTADIPVLGAR